jgi:hypothetical protein
MDGMEWIESTLDHNKHGDGQSPVVPEMFCCEMRGDGMRSCYLSNCEV